MNELVPEARLIYIVRDPVERIVSDYVEQVALGAEQRPIDATLGDVEDPVNFYVCASRYGTQVDNYLKYFERDRLLVIEQWARRPPAGGSSSSSGHMQIMYARRACSAALERHLHTEVDLLRDLTGQPFEHLPGYLRAASV